MASSFLALKLERIDSLDQGGVVLVFRDGGGQERRWVLESTSQAELMALMLRGNIRNGHRVSFPAAEVAVSPTLENDAVADLLVILGPTEILVPMTREAVSTLAAEAASALAQSPSH